MADVARGGPETGRVERHASHFESRAKEVEAGRLGMWVFLASEVLLFSAMFGLYAGYRAQYPAAFGAGVAHNLKWAGSVNTVVLLTSSFLVACAVAAAAAARRRAAAWLLVGTFVLGLVFLGLKGFEYRAHLAEGIVPGGRSAFFSEHAVVGLPVFFNLYYLMTGAHAVHVGVGLGLLAWLAVHILRSTDVTRSAHALELGALYWHLVDLVWIFLWPLFYLAAGRGS